MKISKEQYKGVRDFYPEEMYIQNYIFSKMKETVEKYGYSEYSASILEPTELYKAKTGEEIINEQTYTFTDRGGRDVTLRPEMTPTIARMVAKKKRDLVFPLRWYSIPNMFRYERPQRGRLREHWQLNVDIFGVKSAKADSEIISIAYSLMKNFGAEDKDFEIKINSRKLINFILKDFLEIEECDLKSITKIIDRRQKISKSDFETQLFEILENKTKKLIEILDIKEIAVLEGLLSKNNFETKDLQNIKSLISSLNGLGIRNISFSTDLMRGFDYYTDIVFEIFDKHADNNRSLFGGGRYDDLLDIFGEEKIPAVGFGMGDVTIRDFLEIHNLLPEIKAITNLYICTLSEEYIENANKLAKKLRENNLKVEVDLTDKKIGDQMKVANKKEIPFVICIGEDEIQNNKYKLKNMENGEETLMSEDEIINFLKNHA